MPKLMSFHDSKCELCWAGSEGVRVEEHMCGLQGFGALGDICPRCQGPKTYRPAQCSCGLYDAIRREWSLA